MNQIIVPHSRPFIGPAEAEAAAAVVLSRHIAQGGKVRELEQRWKDVTRTADAAAVGSGLGALRLALLTLDVGPGDEVIVPAYSCVALFNAVLSLGATPVLADVLPDSWTLSPSEVRCSISKKNKAIVAVHLFGHPAEMADLASFGSPGIEDCAHGIGGWCNGFPFGGGGDLSISSFYATKMLAAGEGGIVAGRDRKRIERIRQCREYGDQAADGRNLNDKMTDIEAALALVQLDSMAEILARREARARRYGAFLQPLADVRLLQLPQGTPGRIWYRYTVRLLRHRAAQIAERMSRRGVRAEQPVWDYRGTSIWPGGLTVTATAFDRVLSLPLYPDLSDHEQDLVCAELQRSLEHDE